MDKLKRYLGLAVAILLLVAALVPVDPPDRDLYRRLTPLSATVPTVLIMVNEPKATFWVHATPFLQGLDGCRSRETSECVRHSYRTRKFVVEHRAESDAYAPGLLDLLDNYGATRLSRDNLLDAAEKVKRSRQAKVEEEATLAQSALKLALEQVGNAEPPRPRRGGLLERMAKGRGESAERRWAEAQRAAELVLGAAVPSEKQRADDLLLTQTGADSFADAYDTRLKEFESRIVAALNSYLEALRPGLVITIYAAHALLLLLCALMLWKRDKVGAAILWPFVALIMAAKASPRAAKRFHERV